MTEDRARVRVGSWVSLLSPGSLSGVVVEDAGSGMFVVQLIVGEWMLSESQPATLDEGGSGPD